jgi:uncharacterized tellurite resistance protein B-like protein
MGPGAVRGFGMRKILARLFGGGLGSDSEQRPSDRDFQVAVAALLLHMGLADFELTDRERDRITQLLEKYLDLSSAGAAEIMAEAARQLREKTDIYTFTSRITETLAREDRIPIIEMVWRVIYSDNRLEGNEDQVAHRLFELLGLDHSQLIAAKIKIKKELGENGPGEGF